MEGFTKIAKITNEDVFSGKFKLAFEEICDVPDTPFIYQNDIFRIYYDPKGEGFQNIVCTTHKRKVSINGCILLFPGFPHKKDRVRGFWQTYRCTAYREITNI